VDEKRCFIDRRLTIMGSYNFSAGADRNSEDLNIVTSAEVAETYASTENRTGAETCNA
jgi:phosphatidylserine/phosphatidylglycerophosphate/cardiolipin synthase-like enzyme